MFLKKIIFLIPLLFFFFVSNADAATMYLIPEAKNFSIGQGFFIDVKINTEQDYINAAQATVHFSNQSVSVSGVERTGSIFNFWVEDPVISNDDGTIQFIGGSSSGNSGSSLQILRIKFKVTGSGTAEINLSDAVVTANDGKGTNVLSQIQGTTIGIGTKIIETTKTEEQPQKVERKAVPGTGLPEKPNIRIPLYPDQSRWYNIVGDTIALWDIPPDITGVAIALDKNPNTEPSISEKELVNGKDFGILKNEGIWFVHVQFKNNIGWGGITHYKISLDATAPLPFKLSIDNAVSDNPSPKINFPTQDSLSGIKEAAIYIDGKGPIYANETIFTLPPQVPGKHNLDVRVYDLAGNGVEDKMDFEILPLPTPTIDFVSKSVIEGDSFFASGRSAVHDFVDYHIADSNGVDFLTGKVVTDEIGNWKIEVTQDKLPFGDYVFTVVARDSRDATSFPTEKLNFSVKAKPVLSFWGIDFTLVELLIIIALLVFSAAGFFTWHYFSSKKIRTAYANIAGRDIEKFGTLLSDDLKKVEDLKINEENISGKMKTDLGFLVNKMKDTVLKMKKYLGQEIKKVK